MCQSLVILHPHHHLAVLVFLILAILVNTQGVMGGSILKMVSIYISLMINDPPAPPPPMDIRLFLPHLLQKYFLFC